MLREAKREFRAGAESGDPDCQVNLGYFCEQGIGGPRDVEEAHRWYRRAVRRGHVSAALNIGILYKEQERPRLAARWLKKAVALGNRDALLDLGRLYLEEFDDYRAARRYLQRARTAQNVSEHTREAAQRLLKASRVIGEAAATSRRR
jgi:TPR repeat protein